MITRRRMLAATPQAAFRRLTCPAPLDHVDKHYPRRWPVPARQQE